MCSMVDYEMLVSHSPPVFSHSPPAAGLLSGFASLRLDPYRRSNCKLQHSLSFTNDRPSTMPPPPPTSPKRPCLVIRPVDDSPSSSDEDPTSPTKLKKKVVFADDKGMSLTHVRVMSEPSNVPPVWSMRFLAEVTQGVTAAPEAQKDPWELTFVQPASDYVHFRRRLEQDKVSLENIIVKEADDQIVGTVKVYNISFEKEVFIRSTVNDWESYEDAFCNYVPNNPNVNSAYIVHDTFCFKINLPPSSRKLEFCVCYKTGETEFWDNNNHKNYSIIKKAVTPFHRSQSNDDLLKKSPFQQQREGPRKTVDAVQTKMDSWSEFASWTHLENNHPYCTREFNVAKRLSVLAPLIQVMCPSLRNRNSTC